MQSGQGTDGTREVRGERSEQEQFHHVHEVGMLYAHAQSEQLDAADQRRRRLRPPQATEPNENRLEAHGPAELGSPCI